MSSIPVYNIETFKRKQNPFNDFQVEYFDVNRNFQVEYPHRHDFFEILYITHGSGNHIIDNQEYTIVPNSIFFLTPGQVHTIDVSKDIKGYIFLFTSEFYLLNKQNIHKLLEFPFFYHVDDYSPPLVLNQIDTQLLTDLFQKGATETENYRSDTPEVISAILDLILLFCRRFYPEESSPFKTNKGKLLVKQFKQLLEGKYSENLSVSEYADLLHVTAGHLTEIVKNITGKSSTELIQEKMMLEIKRLLIYTEKSSTEIAFDLNFKDQSYFTRYFKTREGLTPLEYRKKSWNK